MGKHPNDRLQGTLDLLVLKSLAACGPLHRYGITVYIQTIAGAALRVERRFALPGAAPNDPGRLDQCEMGCKREQSPGPLLLPDRGWVKARFPALPAETAVSMITGFVHGPSEQEALTNLDPSA
jgi:hypothetical protein